MLGTVNGAECSQEARVITFEDFKKIEIRTGTILSAALNPKAKKPAYVLEVDFGPLGKKKSSAQITTNYTTEQLIGKQIVAVTNFPKKNIAGVESEVLILGAIGDLKGVILLEPTHPVENGASIG